MFPKIVIIKFKYLFIIDKLNIFNNNNEKVTVFTDNNLINFIAFYLSGNITIII